MKQIKINLATTSQLPEHAFRGIGVYARLLTAALSDDERVLLVDSKRDADILHFPFFDFYFSTLPFNFFKKTVVTIHDTIPLIFSKEYVPGLKGKLRFYRQRFALKIVKAIITDSESSAHDISTYLKVSPDKIFVVPLATDPRFIPQTPEFVTRIKRKFKIPAQYILYVGDINYNKNLQQLIKTMKFLPESIKLVCIGKNFKPQNIPEWKVIETQVALSEVGNQMRFITDLAADQIQELAAIYSGAIAYVHPSLYEGFGLPVLEALRCGTPVVAANNSSIPEVLANAGILVEPTAERLAQAVEKVMSLSTTARQKMIKSGLSQAKKFSLKQMADKTVNVYAQI